MKHHLLAMIPALLLSATPAIANEPTAPRVFEGDPYANETKEHRDERMAWWREAKFGMFIHWGVYAVLAGEYEDIRDAEWIMRGGKIPAARYREYAKGLTAEIPLQTLSLGPIVSYQRADATGAARRPLRGRGRQTAARENGEPLRSDHSRSPHTDLSEKSPCLE